jgi:hypothetical protein
MEFGSRAMDSRCWFQGHGRHVSSSSLGIGPCMVDLDCRAMDGVWV